MGLLFVIKALIHLGITMIGYSYHNRRRKWETKQQHRLCRHKASLRATNLQFQAPPPSRKFEIHGTMGMGVLYGARDAYNAVIIVSQPASVRIISWPSTSLSSLRREWVEKASLNLCGPYSSITGVLWPDFLRLPRVQRFGELRF